MERMSRRSWLRRLINAAVLFVLGNWIDKGLEEVLPDLPAVPITGTLNVTLEPIKSSRCVL